MRTTGKAAFPHVQPCHEALGSDSAMRVAPGSEQTFGRRGETTGTRDGLTPRRKALETRGTVATCARSGM
jgi:hypothetical protein